jgi:hypothetical protein
MSDEELLSDSEEERRAAAARLFDVRRVIGGLFVVYGVIVGTIGIFDGSSAIEKAEGVRVNLWSGLATLAMGLLFLLWQWLRPAEAPRATSDAGDVENGEGDASVGRRR